MLFSFYRIYSKCLDLPALHTCISIFARASRIRPYPPLEVGKNSRWVDFSFGLALAILAKIFEYIAIELRKKAYYA